jgi:hypothetical protein
MTEYLFNSQNFELIDQLNGLIHVKEWFHGCFNHILGLLHTIYLVHSLHLTLYSGWGRMDMESLVWSSVKMNMQNMAIPKLLWRNIVSIQNWNIMTMACKYIEHHNKE